MRKKCTNCEVEKDVNQFYEKKNGLYGKHAECKKCMRGKNKKYREENPEKIYIRNKIYSGKLKELYSESHINSHVRMHERSIIGFERYAEKKMQLLAGSLLNYAIRINLIQKPIECVMCKRERDIQGHHIDYSKPLQVIWVCIECHSNFHLGKHV